MSRTEVALGNTGEGDRQALEEERAFLLRSLTDLEREREAGDIEPADYEALRARYTARAAEVLRLLEGRTEAGTAPSQAPGAPSADGPTPRDEPARGEEPAAGSAEGGSSRRRWRWRRRRWFVVGALACFAAAAVVLVSSDLGVGLPGQPVTGSITLTKGQHVQRLLDQAEEALLEGQPATALAAYRAVLQLEPTEEEALSEAGWLEYAAGVRARRPALVSAGQSEEAKAVAEDPSDPGPRLFLGSMLAQDGSLSQAASQFDAALADHASTDTLAAFASTIEKVDGQLHLPVPAAVRKAEAVAQASGLGPSTTGR
ncbi:tetratricopeptide repeat protein [Aciditerrimonas ferrireducens]|uniref:tetratricopeptide repeat protein n=1 Tax=Aciditerrimonas ferrireducens TaxID=667306 RepID=UPI002006983D|nr:hypothetical protein [Aciditerrimonas ferrireducens]MCK4177016.1 hypothetical protein [Aciditerrimonas ferrireducens]